jgi:hypothetical protein
MHIKPLRRITGLALALLFAVLAGKLTDTAAAAKSEPLIPCEAIDSVGTATMSADGVITLRLHALWPQPYSETALATAADKRASALPQVPTMAEAGISDFDTSLWLGLAAPARTPRPVIEKLADAARQVTHDPEAVAALRKQGYEPNDADPDKFAAFIHSEFDRWSAVTRAAGLKS